MPILTFDGTTWVNTKVSRSRPVDVVGADSSGTSIPGYSHVLRELPIVVVKLMDATIGKVCCMRAALSSNWPFEWTGAVALARLAALLPRSDAPAVVVAESARRIEMDLDIW